MKPNYTGLRRYLYEHHFYLDIVAIQQRSGQILTVSTVRKLREKLENVLRQTGESMENPALAVETFQNALHQVLTGLPGYENGDYRDSAALGVTHPGYKRARESFFKQAGFLGNQPSPGLVISPYDPRWAPRANVKQQGHQNVYISSADVEKYSYNGNVGSLTGKYQNLMLQTRNRKGYLKEIGHAYSADDASGMTELMQYLTQKEYEALKDWVTRIPTEEYMSEAGITRMKAILDELDAEGTQYTIRKDRNPGQLVVHITGTKMTVRLSDTRSNENFVGRAYDDGITTYFSTNYRNSGNRYDLYHPSPSDTVNLLRAAQGKPPRPRENSASDSLEMHPGSLGKYFGNTSDGKKTLRSPYAPHFVNNKPAILKDGSPAQVFIHRETSRSETSTWFGKPGDEQHLGKRFLELAVNSARARFVEELAVDRLIQDFEEHETLAVTGEWVPEYSSDDQVAQIQRGYWAVLCDNRMGLDHPGIYTGDLDNTNVAESATRMFAKNYGGGGQTLIRAHAEESLKNLIGTFTAEIDTLIDAQVKVKSFNPSGVVQYMVSPYGPWRNTNDLVEAMRSENWGETELDYLRGNDSVIDQIRDKLIKFDETTARSIQDLEDGTNLVGTPQQTRFLLNILYTAHDTMARNGLHDIDLRVDANGVIDWRAKRYDRNGQTLTNTYGEKEELRGQIGQVFVPGEHGEVITRFGSGKNYMFTPGYIARVIPQKPGENLTMVQRTRLYGYQQILTEHIQHQLANDVLTSRSEIINPTGLNTVYRNLYDEREETDFLTRKNERGLDRGLAEAILATKARRVRYPKELKETFYEVYGKPNNPVDLANDSFRSPIHITDGQAISVMGEDADGFFDPDLTSNTIPGVVRFLVENAQVKEDGSIVPSDKNDRTPVMKHPDLAYSHFDAFDRRQMTGMGVLHASGVSNQHGVAMMIFEGWTFDDAFVVSKNFAEQNKIVGKNGELRTLIVGDKISDLHGNKGVISRIVDREKLATRYRQLLAASREEAVQIGENEYPHTLFELSHNPEMVFVHNPDLDVVCSPFSSIGRLNAGTAREMIDNKVGDGFLKLLDPARDAEHRDRVGFGKLRFIISHKDVESSTTLYDEDSVAKGRGRKVSAQLMSALASQGATDVIREFYAGNTRGVTALKETLHTLGLGMRDDGTLFDKQNPGGTSPRRLFKMPELVVNDKGRLDRAAMRELFANQISTHGGDMEIPFPLKFPQPPGEVKETGPRYLEEVQSWEKNNPGVESWRLPVLSASLRTGMNLDDGTTIAHEYTTGYLRIFDYATQYRYAKERLAGKHGEISTNVKKTLTKQLETLPGLAQAAYDNITGTLISRSVESRRNIFRENVMGARLPNSATAVWTPNPTLSLDQVGMGTEMMRGLGVEEDEYVLLWRDPILRGAGVRYLRVKSVENLTGVAIHPLIDKGFDGDFDGDSVGIAKINTEKAHANAMKTLSVEANLLDLGLVKKRDNGEEYHPLAFNHGLDVQFRINTTAAYQMQTLVNGKPLGYHFDYAKIFSDIETKVNNNYKEFKQNRISLVERLNRDRRLMDKLWGQYRNLLTNTDTPFAGLDFSDVQAHVESVKRVCVDSGVKGNPAQLAKYTQYLVGADSNYAAGAFSHTRNDDRGIMVANAVKLNVGIAGTYSHRALKAVRDGAQKEILELSYPVTQSLLQSKHNPVEALQKYGLLLGGVRELWRGRQLVRTEDGWETVRAENGDPVQAPKNYWVDCFMDMYESKNGLNVPGINQGYVQRMAEVLSDGNGVMRDIEMLPVGGDTPVLDRLAYGGGFGELYRAAKQQKNIFGGGIVSDLAPVRVRYNQKKYEQDTGLSKPPGEGEIMPVLVRDVLPETHPGVLGKITAPARTVIGLVKTQPAQEVQEGAYEMV